MKELDNRLSVFGFGLLQDLVALLDILEREKISLEDVRSYVKERIANTQARIDLQKRAYEKKVAWWNKVAKRCPKCDTPMSLIAITTPKGKANKKGYKSLWSCPKTDCTYEKYMKTDRNVILKRLWRG